MTTYHLEQKHKAKQTKKGQAIQFNSIESIAMQNKAMQIQI